MIISFVKTMATDAEVRLSEDLIAKITLRAKEEDLYGLSLEHQVRAATLAAQEIIPIIQHRLVDLGGRHTDFIDLPVFDVHNDLLKVALEEFFKAKIDKINVFPVYPPYVSYIKFSQPIQILQIKI